MALVDRWYDILYILETTPCIAQGDLEQMIGTSRQTLKRNIQLLNMELKDSALVEYNHQHYSLKVNDFEAFDLILQGKLRRESDFNSSSKRMAYILKQLIEKVGTVNLNDLSDELMVSRSTVANDLSELRRNLKCYNLQIIGRTNRGITIEGEEMAIRLVYVNIVLEYFPLERLDNDLQKLIYETVEQLGILKQTIPLLIRVIETAVRRIDQGNNLTKISPWYENFMQGSEAFEEFISFLEEAFSMTFSFVEKTYLSYPLNVFNQGKGDAKEYRSEKLSVLFKRIMVQIQQLVVVNVDEQRLFSEMQTHLAHLLNRLVMRVPINDLFLRELEVKYPLANVMAKEAGKAIADTIQRIVPEVEINYLTLYFEMAINRDENEGKKQIAVVCHTGHGTAEIIKRQLQSILGEQVVITAYSQSEINEELMKDYFAVFTTIPLRGKVMEVPIIQLNLVIDNNYVLNEWEKLGKHQSLKDEHVIVRLTKVDKNNSYIGNLMLMASRLVDQGLCGKDFPVKIYEREQLKSTVFENGIAMPHAVNVSDSRIILNVGQFNRNESPNGVEIIFMLAVPETQTEAMETALLTLYDFIFVSMNQTSIRQELKQAEQGQDILKIIQREVRK